MKKLIHEPLVHFLALAAVLFGIGILRGEGMVYFTYDTNGFTYYVTLGIAGLRM